MYIDDNYVGDLEDFWLGENRSVYPKKYQLHKCKDGTIKCINGTHPKYDCMMNDHLLNTIKWIERKAEEGLDIYTAGGGVDAEDIWFDEDTLFGEEVKDKMNYKVYVTEAKKRKQL